MKFRIGFGYDVHQLKEGCDFWLGGVRIPHTKGAVGHSDADVLIHAICDALLGAANMRDIGYHFPDTSTKFRSINSKVFLTDIIRMVEEKGFKIGNIDTTICLQQPKVSSYISEMKKVLAKVMNINESDLSIKATTTEKMGFVGKEEGITAYAVALITSD